MALEERKLESLRTSEKVAEQIELTRLGAERFYRTIIANDRLDDQFRGYVVESAKNRRWAWKSKTSSLGSKNSKGLRSRRGS